LILLVNFQKKKFYSFNNLFFLSENNSKTDDDGIYKAEQRANNAEQRAYIAEEQISKLHEQLKVCFASYFS
jgi:hypothetical protein